MVELDDRIVKGKKAVLEMVLEACGLEKKMRMKGA